MKEKSFETYLLDYARDTHRRLDTYGRFLDNLSAETWGLMMQHLRYRIRDLFL